MSIQSRDVFKMVALRGSIKGLTIDPSEYLDSQTPLLGKLSQFEFIPSAPTAEVQDLLRRQHALDEQHLTNLVLTAAFKAVEASISSQQAPLTLEELGTIVFSFHNSDITLSAFGANEQFQKEYSKIVDSWIVLALTNNSSSLIKAHVNLLRVGAICRKLSKIKNEPDESTEILQLLDALVIFPRQWRQAMFDRIEVDKKLKERLKFIATRPPLDIDKNIKNRQKEFDALTSKAVTRESLQSKIRGAYWEFKKDSFTNGDDVGVRKNRLSGPSIPLTAKYFTLLDSSLTSNEKTEFNEIKSSNNLPSSLNNINNLVASSYPMVMWGGASSACADIQVWETEKKQALPKPNITGLGEEYAAIRSVGWGDLTVIREKLIGYDANEIAHIENILPGELRLRENERTYATESFEETETESINESQQELETSDRQELQVQAQKTINTDFSVSAGVNTSGRYGVTKVDTSLTADFQRSKSESRSSSTSLAKEIISKSVEKTFESIRELRRTTITQQMRELNRHQIDNSPKEGAAAPVSHSGVYLWVEKVKELQLFHYGTRLMVEFHIPEPALSLLEQRTMGAKDDIKKPAPFKISPSYITPATYQCLAQKYNVDGLEPPPANWVSVGKGWNSMPDEGADSDTAEDVETLEIKIPDGYFPYDGFVAVSIQTKNESTGNADSKKIFFSLSVGGIETPIQYPNEDDVANDSGDAINRPYEILFDKNYPWPESTVPVNFRAHGHFDKTMYVQITVNCQRTNEHYTDWQLRTWEQIKSGHQILMNNYQQELREKTFASAELFETRGRPEKENRRVEREELQKWATKIMRNESFMFNAVEEIGDIAEISALASNDQAEIIQFFEETFEWDYMSYILYPYFWGRRNAWDLRMDIKVPDSRHLEFLKAGACRVIVPVTPGHEEQFLKYIDQSTDVDEIDRIRGNVNGEEIKTDYPIDTEFEDLWLELLLYRKEEVARGSGTLSLTNGSNTVKINSIEINEEVHGWVLSERDLGREVYIAGHTFTITAIIDKSTFEINKPHEGQDDNDMNYAVGSVPYSSPWLVKLPTSHLVLREQKDLITTI